MDRGEVSFNGCGAVTFEFGVLIGQFIFNTPLTIILKPNI